VTRYTFDHVMRLTDEIGMFEHADHSAPRREHGYCTDDMARLLIVAVREPEPSGPVQDCARMAMRFLTGALHPTGTIRNRRAATGRWTDRPGVEDCWGRALWAFGTAVRYTRNERTRQMALSHFERGARQRSPYRRSMVFATLGAANVFAVNSDHDPARLLLIDGAAAIGRPLQDPDWPWPEPRLCYANAALPEALLASGDCLQRSDLVEDGLTLLRWLLERETLDAHLSPTPVGGAGPGDRAPRFDQQPIEIAAMAGACHQAAVTTGDTRWLAGVQVAARWFTGENDAGAAMLDPRTGGAYDGLQPSGPNLNQGAESTLALIATLQLARRADDGSEAGLDVMQSAPEGTPMQRASED
jgi:hypothetical protein